jgi:hypothetical protein
MRKYSKGILGSFNALIGTVVGSTRERCRLDAQPTPKKHQLQIRYNATCFFVSDNGKQVSNSIYMGTTQVV